MRALGLLLLAGRACAVRRGRWKGVREMPSKDPILFALEADPAGLRDVASKHPDVVRGRSAA